MYNAVDDCECVLGLAAYKASPGIHLEERFDRDLLEDDLAVASDTPADSFSHEVASGHPLLALAPSGETDLVSQCVGNVGGDCQGANRAVVGVYDAAVSQAAIVLNAVWLLLDRNSVYTTTSVIAA